MNNMIRGGKLCIETNGDHSTVEVAGTSKDILFNWVALTHQVCKTLDTEPFALAFSMPGMIRDYERTQLKGVKTERKEAYLVRTGGAQG